MDSSTIAALVREISKNNGFQWSAQVVATIFGCIVIGICIPIIIWLVKKGLDAKKTKSPEEIKKETAMLTRQTETYILVKDTRDDVKDIKSDLKDIKETQKDHEKRLTGMEVEHKMYSKSFHCKTNPDGTKKMKYIRALVVDDDYLVLELMNDFFHTRLPKNDYWKKKYIFQVDKALSYEEGEKALNSNKYDLALFDYRLKDPVKTGFHLWQYCKNNNILINGNGKPNAIIYSGCPDLKDVPREYASYYINKPGTEKEWDEFENKLKEMI